MAKLSIFQKPDDSQVAIDMAQVFAVESCEVLGQKLLNLRLPGIDYSVRADFFEVIASVVMAKEMANPSFDGVWVAYHSDRSAVAAFHSELQALRHAQQNGMLLKYLKPGEEL